jgi:hypothetical protein
MSAHAARPGIATSRLVKRGQSVLMRVAFTAAGAAVTAGLAGIVALALW